MANGYFIGPDGKRREFDRDGRETTPGMDGAQAAPRLTRMPPGSPAGGSQSLTRAIPQPVTPAPGALNAPIGSLSVMPSNASAPTLTRSAPLIRPQATAQPQAAPLTREPAGNFVAGIPQAGQQAPVQTAQISRPQMNMTRTAPNPDGSRAAAVLDPMRSAGAEMVRRSDMAASRLLDMARAPKGTYTAAQLRTAGEALGTSRNFWADQAASIGVGAQQRFLEAQKLRSGEEQALAGMANQNEQQMAQQSHQAKLSRDRSAAQMDQLQAKLNAPQQIVQADGTVGYASPGGTFQPLTDASGGLVRAPMQQPVDQSALSRLVPSLTEQFLGADQYGMVPDPSAKNGRRPATAADRQSAFERATVAARETLGGGSSATPPQASSSAPVGSPPGLAG